jgi:hypothetical protein
MQAQPAEFDRRRRADGHHGLGLSRCLLSETLRTRPHLNRAGPGVEEGRPRCVGTLILRVAGAATTVVVATAPVAATITAVVVLLAGLLQWALLLLLLSGGGGPPEEVGTDGGLGAA